MVRKALLVLVTLSLVVPLLFGCVKEEPTPITPLTEEKPPEVEKTEEKVEEVEEPTEEAETPVEPTKDYSNLEPFKVSIITTLTGNNAYGGAEYKNGSELALEHLGGSINGRKIELVIADGPDQNATLSEFERLYNNGSRLFLSGYGSPGDLTFASMADDMEVLYFSLNWSKDLIQGPSDYFFRVGANVIDFSTSVADSAAYIAENYLNKKPSELTVAIVYLTAINYVAEPIKARAEELGMNVAVYEGYAYDTTDWVPLITKLQNTVYDILIPVQATIDGTPFQKKMYELGYKPPVTLGAGIYYDTPIFADLGNEITSGILSVSYTVPYINDAAAKGVTKFREEYTAKYGHAPLTHALQAYSGMQAIFKVLEQVPPDQWEDTKLLADTLKAIKVEYGELTWYWGIEFDELNNNVKADQFIIGQWLDGKFECVGPDFLKTADPIIPYGN